MPWLTDMGLVLWRMLSAARCQQNAFSKMAGCLLVCRDQDSYSIVLKLVNGKRDICDNFPRQAGAGANYWYRQKLQEVAKSAANFCEIPSSVSANEKYLAQISTSCLPDKTTRLAQGIQVSYKTISLKGVSDSKRTCFFDFLRSVVDVSSGREFAGSYPCHVADYLYDNFPQWTPETRGSCGR